MMKKLLVLAILGSFSVVGCSNSGEPKEKSASASNEITSPVHNVAGEEVEGTIHLTKQDFLNKVMDYEKNPQEWIYKGDKPCIIDFYASWCGPCKIASPILEELAAEYKDDIYIYKINTEVERELAAVFGIQSIPTFIYVPLDGNPSMSNGIARTPEETKQHFINIIDNELLGKGAQESL